MPEPDKRPPEPQGQFACVPYDLRPPTTERMVSRWWNSNDKRLFTPKVLGWGHDLNLYWLVHPLRYLTSRFGSRARSQSSAGEEKGDKENPGNTPLHARTPRVRDF